MTFEEDLRAALDRALAGARANLERDVHALAAELADRAAEARGRTAAMEMDELRGRFDREMIGLAADIESLDGATSLGQVLRTLVECAKRHTDRAGIFLVADGGLHPWPAGGPEPSVPELLSLEEGPARTFPLVVGGTVVATLYAPVADAALAPALLDALTRHASRVLESLTLYKTLGLAS